MAATHVARGGTHPAVHHAPQSTCRRVVLLCLCLPLLLAAPPASAQWIRGWVPGDGNFEDPANWLPEGMPQPADTAAFLMAGVSEVTFASDHPTHALSVGQGYVGLLLGGHTYSVTDPSSVYPCSINVGFLENVYTTLELHNGMLAGQHAVIGAHPKGGGTVVVDTGAIWTNTGTLYVGYAGAGELNVQNGGVLTSQHGCIGLVEGSIGQATVTGTGSGWGTMHLSVGGSATAPGGVLSSLTVGDGGCVVASGTLKVWPFSAVTLEADGLIAADTFEGTVGCVATAAAGSELRVNHLVGWGNYVGSTAHFTLGHALGSGSGSLAVGAGQTLVAGQDLTVGYDAPGTLAISGGGQVSSVNGYLGPEVGSIGTVTVTGAESAWTVSGSLQVGDEDAGPTGGTGTLNVGGGLVSVADALRLGDNGTVDVSGGEVHAATLHVGGTSGVGGTCSLRVSGGLVSVADTLTMGDYDPIINLSGGLLAADTFERGSNSIVTTAPGSSLTVNHLVGWGDHVAFGGNFTLGNALGSGSGSLTVGAGQTLTVAQNFTVGSVGTVTLDGGTIAAQVFDRTAGTFDWNAGTLRFTDHLLVDTGQPFGSSVSVGSGRDLEVAGTLTVGSAGTVTLDGGTITTTSFQNTAYGTFSHHDGTFTVSGGTFAPGTTYLTVNGNTPTALPHLVLDGVTVPGVYAITIGDDAQGALTISGGQVSSRKGYLGYLPGSTGAATVTGEGSTWTNSGTLYVGLYGAGTLTVEDGGQVSSGLGYLGYGSGSTGTATVTGADSKWTNSSGLIVGYYGAGTLTAEAGGQVSNTDGHLGDESGSTGTATVTGADSTWTNSGDLFVGRYGAGTLTVEAGGQVSNTDGHLGDESGSTGTASVTGEGSTWTNSGDLNVGRYGGAGTLTVADGGLVSAKTLYASPSNLFGDGTITAHGAVLDADLVFDSTHGLAQSLSFGTGGTLDLDVDGTGGLGAGHRGTGTLHIADGVAVASAGGYLGYRSGSTGAATVTGEGSTWTNSGTLYVGSSGAGTLTVEAGGQVSNSSGYLGYWLGSSGTATVTGAGSTWTNSGDLCVGYFGAGTLTVEAGGQVASSGVAIGFQGTSTGIVTVDGSGSTCTATTGDLLVGYDGAGTLAVTGGGQVTTGHCAYVGTTASSTGGATVEGSGSTWTTTGGLYVGGSDVVAGGAGSVAVQNGGHLAVGETLVLWKADSEVTANAGTLTAGALEGTTGILRITDPAGGTALTLGSAASGIYAAALTDDTGPGSLTKVGTGEQTLAGAGIAYTGATTVLEGLLKLSDTTAFASAITNDADVEFEATTGTWIFDNALGGAGTFVKNGDGTLVISGPQDYDAGALFEVLTGTVEMNTAAGAAGDADLSILVQDAELHFGTNQHLDTLAIGADGLVRLTGANVVVVRHLILDGLDLGATTLTPEPATLALLAVGGLSLLACRKRRRVA